jgi:hypothetical protein
LLKGIASGVRDSLWVRINIVIQYQLRLQTMY